jgi:hypothetical protein
MGDLPIIISHSFASLMLFVHLHTVYLNWCLSCSIYGPVFEDRPSIVGPGVVTLRKILNSVVDEVSEALSMHVMPPAIRIVVVPTVVTVLLGLHKTPCSWTGTVGPSLPGFTIAPCVDSLLCYRLIRRSKSILQDSPKI